MAGKHFVIGTAAANVDSAAWKARRRDGAARPPRENRSFSASFPLAQVHPPEEQQARARADRQPAQSDPQHQSRYSPLIQPLGKPDISSVHGMRTA